MLRILYIALLCVVAITFCKTGAEAEEWPIRPITVVNPFGSGTTIDIIAHIVLDPAGLQLGQPFVVTNRAGANGAAGIASVIKAPPDGYTLLLSSSAITTSVILHKNLAYDLIRDLVPVAMLGGEPSILLAAPEKGYTSVADLVASAKAHPDEIKFGSVGIGSASHIAGEYFRIMADLQVQHVTYPGASELIADLSAGRLDFIFAPVTPALPLITQGKAVPIAVSTPNRLQSLPGLPTLAESGFPIPTYLTWCGLSAPADTPLDVVKRLNAEIARSLALPAVRSKMLRTGYLPSPMTPDQFAAFISTDITQMIELRKNANIAPFD